MIRLTHDISWRKFQDLDGLHDLYCIYIICMMHRMLVCIDQIDQIDGHLSDVRIDNVGKDLYGS